MKTLPEEPKGMEEEGLALRTGLCSILILEDRPEDAELARRELREAGLGCIVHWARDKEAFEGALSESPPDLILSDYFLPGYTGLEALETAKRLLPDVPVIMYTGSVNEETAVACLKAGADDYILKSHPARLAAAVANALRARRDRVERRRMRAALEETRERFRVLVETANDAILTFDSSGLIEFSNPATEAIFGYSASELVGESVFAILDPRSRQLLKGVLSGAAPQAEVERDTLAAVLARRRFLGVRKDGTQFPVEISLSAWDRGGSRFYNCVIRDTTERLIARKALEELSQRYELLLNSAGEGIIGVDAGGTVTFANPAALALLERSGAEVLGESVHPLLHGPDPGSDGHAEADCPILGSLEDGTCFRGEVAFVRKGGRSFPVALSCTPIKLESGSVQGAVLVFEDITYRREQENALRASEARYRGLVDHATYGIYRSSPEGEFLSVNPALVEMLGFESEKELLALNLNRDLYQNPAQRADLMRVFRTRDVVRGIEAKWLRKDGTPITVRLSGRQIAREDGSLEAFEVIVEDLTERKALEDQLRQAQKMEAVGQLTGGIAHDFNNVLGVILLNAELMASSLNDGGTVDPVDLESIQNAAKRATSITRKLLSFSRRAELDPRPSSLETVVGNMASMLRTLLPETIELDLDLRNGLPPVEVDPGSIEQILLNLVTNSRDAMGREGLVRVSVRAVDLDLEHCRRFPDTEPGPFVCLEVSDSGCGMDEDTLRRVFDPFFTTKAPGAGTGLGMAMVYGLTTQQGGHVDMSSVVGQGTTTRLYFPSTKAAPSKPESKDETPAMHQGPRTVLVIEDEANLRLATGKALERRGHRVLTASDGEEALHLLADQNVEVDLVISDLVLPGMNGLDLIDRIRARHERTRAIITSGYSGLQERRKANVPEDVPFLRKPWQLADFLALVEKVLAEGPVSHDP